MRQVWTLESYTLDHDDDESGNLLRYMYFVFINTSIPYLSNITLLNVAAAESPSLSYLHYYYYLFRKIPKYPDTQNKYIYSTFIFHSYRVREYIFL